jgi:superfamily II DNA or RNA helicase
MVFIENRGQGSQSGHLMMPDDDTKATDIDTLIAAAENRIKAVEIERQKAIAELEALHHEKEAGLRNEPVSVGVSYFPNSLLTKDSPASAKINFFRSLFKGRQDVFARRWESATSGKSGYQPACANEWTRGICRKPEIKCGGCPSREFLPLADDVLKNHLIGHVSKAGQAASSFRDFTIGIYPILADETCWFLAADFDKKAWHQDVAAFRKSSARHNINVAIERSRSGNGAHVWIFFAEPVPVVSARRLGTFLITETLEDRPEIGFDSYDRLFPSQDFLPEGGFGNLIALPLQGRSKEQGNTLFLDDEFIAYPDQWAFLSSLRRLRREDVEHLVDDAARHGKIMGVRLPATDDEVGDPWKWAPSRKKISPLLQGPFPENVKVVLGDLIYIDKANLPPALRSQLIRLAAFQNPEFYKAQAMRLSAFGKPRVITCAEDFPAYIGLPRGCFVEVEELFASLGIRIQLSDERNIGRRMNLNFFGELRHEQEMALAALKKHDIGILAAATAFGKTVVAAKMIAERGVNTLILVHRRQLLDQWRSRLTEFLQLSRDQIGEIGGGKRRPTGLIDVALIQSLHKKGKVDDIVADYGQIIVDECHHIPAQSFEQVSRRCKAKYFLGLSATVIRKDGHHPIIYMQCGAVRFRVSARQGSEMHPFKHRVVLRNTLFDSKLFSKEKRPTIHQIYEELMLDKGRNELIFDDVVKCIAGEKRSPIVLTERREHLDILADSFRPFVKNVIVFRGGMGVKQRNAIYEELKNVPAGEERLLIATGRYLGEGFDDARLDTLFLTMPISWKGTLVQYAGRLHRLYFNKKGVRIYDYVDAKVPMLDKMHKRRLHGYRAIGYEIS